MERLPGPGAHSDQELLLERLEYLMVEIDALRPLFERVAPEVLRASPLPGQLSATEMFSRLLARDAEALRLLGARMTVAADEGELPLSEVLERLRSARSRLVDELRDDGFDWRQSVDLPDGGSATAVELVGMIVEQDLAALRTLAERLGTARLFDPAS